MKKVVMSVLTVCAAQVVALEGFTAGIQQNDLPSCIQAASALAEREAREVGVKYMKYGFETEVIFNPQWHRTPEGYDEPVQGGVNVPMFITLGEEPIDMAKRAKSIADGYLVEGDMIYLVQATMKRDFVQSIRPDARADWGIEGENLTGHGGVLIVRCRMDRPLEVEKIWWQSDVKTH